MKVGVNLLNFGPGASPDSLARWTQLSETLGYHIVMVCDHVAITPDVQSRYPAPFYDPFIAMAWLAGITSKIEIGTTVIIVPYRNPIEVAKMVANLDQISGGRIIFGVGIGWAKQEFEALGVPFNKRGAITNDYLAAIKTLWTKENATYHGRFTSFDNVTSLPRPARNPHPPIWVGGPSDAALKRAVRYGDGWHPIRIRMDWFRDTGIPRLKEIAEAEQKPVPALCPRVRLRITESPMDDGRIVGEGTLDQIRRDFEELESLGVEYVLLDTYTDDIEATRNHEASWSMLTTIAERVLDLENQTLR